MGIRRLHRIAAALLLIVAATWNGSTFAQESADTLRIVWWQQIANLNPYYNQIRPGLIVSHEAFDGLLYRDPETFETKPLLATSWKYVDATTLEFQLRRGVTFQDGSPFSADDVAYTVNSILIDKQVSIPANYAWMLGADKIDDYTVRIRTRGVFPVAAEFLSLVMPILPKAYRERVGSDAYDKLPLGAGPYRITKVDGVTAIEMERYEGYYPESLKGRPAIRRLHIHAVTDVTTVQNELIGGKADWAWNVPPDNIEKLGRLPHLQATGGETMRVVHLLLDVAGRTGAGNPMTKTKVRQAIAHAIDREAIAKNLMPGSRVLDTPCYPSQFGCNVSAAVPYPYDPAKARALLAEAGYPKGFQTEIVSFQLPFLDGAVQHYLQAIGIDAKVTHLQVEAAVRRNLEGTIPIYLADWASFSINDASAYLGRFTSPNLVNYAANDSIRDPVLKKLVEEGSGTTNPATRRRAYSEAIRLATEQAYIAPLLTSVAYYAARREVSFRTFPDELPRFYLMHWR